jgi:twitching motility protein PilT
MQLADILVWIFSQRLLKWKSDWKLHMVKEILINTTAISNLIRENDLHQIPSIMQMWWRDWMQLLEKDLIDLIKEWVISEEEWLKYSNNPKTIKESL